MKRTLIPILVLAAALSARAASQLRDIPLTNTVYTSQEVDAAIAASSPADYATVSNRAMTAVQPLAPVSGGRIVVSNQDGGIEESFSSIVDFVNWTSAEQFAQKSELGTAASKDVPTSGNAIASQVVMGNDTRLSDARTPTAHTHVQADVDGLVDALAGKAAATHTHTTSDISDFPTIPTVPTNVSYFTNDAGYLTAHQSLAGYATTAALGAAAVAATNYTDAAIAAATQAAPTWDTTNVGANPTVALAVTPNTAYMRTGTGTLTLSAVTGLTAAPTYCVFGGFDSLVLPAGFAVAGSGSFRAGHENHLTLWASPTTNLVNFLFAQ